MFDLEVDDYVLEFKAQSPEKARLSDEFNYGDDYGYDHLARWHNRDFVRCN